MPRTKGALEHSEFQRSRIVGQYKGGHSQCRISKHLSMSLVTVNRVIMKCSREGRTCTASRLFHAGATD